MAGMTSHQVTLGIFDPDTQQTVDLETNGRATLNDPEHYLTCVSWRPDGKQLAFNSVHDGSRQVYLRNVEW